MMDNGFDPMEHAGADEGLDTAPHNLDAEQALLGALLYDNEVFYGVADWLRLEHFYDPVHARIYEAATGYIAKGARADAVVLKTHFERDSGLQEIGGVPYLALLMESAADSAAAKEYAKIVHELATRRELIRVGKDLATAATEGSADDPREIIVDAEAKLFSLAEKGVARGGLKSFKLGLEKSLQMVATAHEGGDGLSGISTGIRSLDEKLGGLHPSDLIVLAGRPSMGKTALATNIGFNVARAYNYADQPDGTRKTVAGGIVAFYSLEMSEEQLSTRLLAEYTGIPGIRMRKGQLNSDQYGEVRDAILEIQNLPLFIDDTGGIHISKLAASARRQKRKTGLDLIIVDYLQLITSSKQGEGRVQELSEITMGLKNLAKELDVPVIALSQLSRQVEQRQDKKPQLSDLRESGSIEQDADVVMFVYREAYYKEREKPREDTPEYLAWQDEFERIENLAEVIIGKQRHGPIDTAQLKFTGATTSFRDLEGA
jgi:replicative DNA helicase